MVWSDAVCSAVIGAISLATGLSAFFSPGIHVAINGITIPFALLMAVMCLNALKLKDVFFAYSDEFLEVRRGSKRIRLPWIDIAQVKRSPGSLFLSNLEFQDEQGRVLASLPIPLKSPALIDVLHLVQARVPKRRDIAAKPRPSDRRMLGMIWGSAGIGAGLFLWAVFNRATNQMMEVNGAIANAALFPFAVSAGLGKTLKKAQEENKTESRPRPVTLLEFMARPADPEAHVFQYASDKPQVIFRKTKLSTALALAALWFLFGGVLTLIFFSSPGKDPRGFLMLGGICAAVLVPMTVSSLIWLRRMAEFWPGLNDTLTVENGLWTIRRGDATWRAEAVQQKFHPQHRDTSSGLNASSLWLVASGEKFLYDPSQMVEIPASIPVTPEVR